MSHQHSPILRAVALAHQTPAERYWQARALVAEQHAAQCFAAYTSATERARAAEQAHARAQERTRDALKYVEVSARTGPRLQEVRWREEEVERQLARMRTAFLDEMRRNSELRRRVEKLEKEKETTQEAVGDALQLVEAARARRRARDEERASENS